MLLNNWGMSDTAFGILLLRACMHSAGIDSQVRVKAGAAKIPVKIPETP